MEYCERVSCGDLVITVDIIGSVIIVQVIFPQVSGKQLAPFESLARQLPAERTVCPSASRRSTAFRGSGNPTTGQELTQISHLFSRQDAGVMWEIVGKPILRCFEPPSNSKLYQRQTNGLFGQPSILLRLSIFSTRASVRDGRKSPTGL